jgi:hypothetical protein
MMLAETILVMPISLFTIGFSKGKFKSPRLLSAGALLIPVENEISRLRLC